MTSASRRSEEALATLALAGRRARSVLVGGLGMGFTLRAALDALGADARVTVAEIDPTIVAWCEGPLAEATRGAVKDSRVRVELGDVARAIARARPGGYDAIALDLYEGPYAADGVFGARGLASAAAALAPGGALAVWSEDDAPGFGKRLGAAGFAWETHRIAAGRTGRRHVVYVATRAPGATQPAPRAPGPRRR